MSAERTPWWYSGEEPGPQEGPATTGSTLDWSALMSGAQRLVDWAADAVLVPHAEHDDPRAHPSCLMCRASLLLGESRATAEPTEPAPAAEPIRWLPIRD